jgi:hypothetical protein
MKKALLGLANNISSNIEKIKLWSQSFKKYCDHDVVLLLANADNHEIELCRNIGIVPVCVSVPDVGHINHKRLEHTANFLQNSDIDLCIITDVFDVAFQGDPFSKLDINNYDIFVSGEGVNVNNEPWNFHNIKDLFPNELSNCLNKEVICSGIIAGKKDALVELYNKMFNLCENSTNKHNIQDQAALMVLIYKNDVSRLKVFNLDDGWAMHCAVAGPTQFFDSWGFRNNLKYTIPQLNNNKVYTGKGLIFDMVHQFNRIPEWHNIIKNEYSL